MGGALGTVWRVLALASVPCLAAAGLARKQGRRPFFLLHMTVCLFLVVHIVNQYRSWSGNPQLQDYAFSLFGQVAMVFFAYYTAAFDVGLGKRRMQLGMGLAAVYLNLTGLSWGDYPLVCLGCLAWAFTDLCALTPKPRPKKTESEPNVS